MGTAAIKIPKRKNAVVVVTAEVTATIFYINLINIIACKKIVKKSIINNITNKTELIRKYIDIKIVKLYNDINLTG